MTTFINTAEIGLTNGVAVTTANSGGGSGNTAFTKETNTTGALVVDNTSPHRGTYSFKFDSPASTDFIRGVFTVNSAHLCIEPYVKFAGFLTTGEQRVLSFISASTSCSLQVTSGGKFRVYDNSGGTALWTSANTISTGVWYRISFGCDVGGSTTTGTLRFQFSSGTNLETNTPDETPYTLSTLNTGTINMTGIRFGHTTTGIRPSLRMDDVQYSDSSSAIIGAPGGTAPINSYTITYFARIDPSATSGTPTSQTVTQSSGPTVTVTGSLGTSYEVSLPVASAAVLSLVSGNGSGTDTDAITILPAGTTSGGNVIRDFREMTSGGLV